MNVDPRDAGRRTRAGRIVGLAAALALWLGLSAAAWAQEDSPPDAPNTPPEAAYLDGIWHDYQTWNNCGPATLSMGLSYWGWEGNQHIAANALRPNPEDKNVSPAEMVAFVRAEVPGVDAVYRYAGDFDTLKRLVAAGYPVIVETGFDPEDLDWMGHYRLIVGYNDWDRTIYTFDSYRGPGAPISYDDLDMLWQHFNRVYVVPFAGEREAEVARLLGEDVDPTANVEHARRGALAETEAVPDNPFAWFNLGTAYVLQGEYEKAAAAYDEARNLGLPWRMLWYQFGPLEAYLRVGRYDDVFALADPVGGHTPYVEEIHYYRGMAYMMRGDELAARHMFNRALRYNPNFTRARRALKALSTLP